MFHLDGINLRVAPGKNLGIDIHKAVTLGIHLKRLSVYERFDWFIANFSNPSQIEDTIFETAVAIYCTEKGGISNLRFAPEYMLKGGSKRPDFEIETSRGVVVCECKRVHVEEHRFSQRVDRIFSKLCKIVPNIPNKDNLRIDVGLVGIITEDLARAISNVGSNIRHALQSGNIGEIQSGAFKIRITEKNRPPNFGEMDLQKSRIASATFPVKVDPRPGMSPGCDFWFGAIDRDLEKVTGALMTDARKQLPRTKCCAIFVRGGSVRASVGAAERRINESAYEHILCFGIEDNPFRFVSRRENQETIKDIFGT